MSNIQQGMSNVQGTKRLVSCINRCLLTTHAKGKVHLDIGQSLLGIGHFPHLQTAELPSAANCTSNKCGK
jgi:hypothetical protein